ncbi:MAG: efflux transporter outer membrane subunit [Deltaproteobacteria bacterium]|nr:efflux transporter outer membrane subunit [Deltaproteobacteria bacterium]TLN02941.1 MAG: efflux transporter outer membrane subunit [bacterium]
MLKEYFQKARAISIVTVCVIVTGCAVGPDFRSPERPAVKQYTPEPLPVETASAPGVAGAAQRFISGSEIAADWWTLFHSESLNALMRQALADSPSLAAAQARLREAEENLRARGGTVYYPSVDGDFSVVRRKSTGASFGQPSSDSSSFTLFNATVNVSYTLDIFGGNRRELEALRAQVDYQRFLLEGAYLSLTANIATAAVKEASLRGQLRAAAETVSLLEKHLEIVDQQYLVGALSRSEVLAQRTQLAQVRATLPPLEKELAQTRHQLSVLTGKLPGEGGLPEFELENIELPAELPVSLPSSLVRQRPDIRAAEELLHAACAQVGVATANLYPKITLNGSIGTNAVKIEDLFSTGSSIWSLGAGLLQPIFHGGELSAKRRAAIAAHDQAIAQYRETVLQAFQNVADTLRALDFDARTLRAQADAELAARESLEMAQEQFRLGAINYLILLNAERDFQQAQSNLIQARAARFADTAALFQALGGGWWNRDQRIDSAAKLDKP